MELLPQALGFVSACLVALIALGFGAMFLFFSGSAALVLGQFVRFGLDLRVLLPVVGIGVAGAAWLAYATGAPYPFALPLAQALFPGAAAALVWARGLHRAARIGAGAALLSAGVLFVASLAAEPLEGLALLALWLAAWLLTAAVLGFWPLIVAGLLAHRAARPVEWFISLRYLVAKRRQTFISVITIICVTGVALGVAVITVVLSVMNGFSRVWEEKIIGTRSHLVVHSRLGMIEDYAELRRRIAAVPGVVGATPFVAADAILRSPGGDLQAVVLKGIDPSTVGEALEIEHDVVVGSLGDLVPRSLEPGGAALPGAVIGSELADRFFLRLGDPVILISPLGGASTPLGPAPRMVRFRVAGVFRADFFQFDESIAYTDLAGAQAFLKLGDVVGGIEVRTDDPYRSGAVAESIEGELSGPFFARDWKTFFPGFFRALVMERVMMFVLLSFIMVVAGFIIISTLIMMIMEKSRDIAILKTMGCDDDGVLRIFAIQGVLIGLAGLALGLGMGLVITTNIDIVQDAVEGVFGFDVLPANVYQLQHFPYDVVPWHLGLISAIAMVLATGATLLPSWQAARLDPAEALRYD
jgi:lipoprotein-releasing system permease protein